MLKPFLRKIQLEIQQNAKEMHGAKIPFWINFLEVAANKTNQHLNNWHLVENTGEHDLISDDQPLDISEPMKENPALEKLAGALQEKKKKLMQNRHVQGIRGEIYIKAIDKIISYILKYVRDPDTLKSIKIGESKFINKKLKHPFFQIVENILLKNHNVKTYAKLLEKEIKKTNNLYETCTNVLDQINKISLSELLTEATPSNKFNIPSSLIRKAFAPTDIGLHTIRQELLNSVEDEQIRKLLDDKLRDMIKNTPHLMMSDKKPEDYFKEMIALLRKALFQPLIGQVMRILGDGRKFDRGIFGEIYHATVNSPNLNNDEKKRLLDLCKIYSWLPQR